MATFKEIQDKLIAVDVSRFVEQKKSGGEELSYLPWANAWGELIKIYPNASYSIERFGEEKLPYIKTKEGYMVFTTVTIEGETREMWLPVMDSHNEAMKDVPYTITYNSGKQVKVEAATMMDINKAIMRCLVKNLAMFGLGINIYQGEDLPNVEEAPIVEKPIACSACGKPIQPVKTKSGKVLTVNQIAERTKEQYGAPMCVDCATKKQAEEKKGETDAE